MKYIFSLLMLCLACMAQANPGTYQKLTEVNHCWSQQQDAGLPAFHDRTEKEWIRLHLQLVEQRLRSKTPAGLNAEQAQQRSRALDDLHRYWLAGNFPINEHYSYRTPIFIDEHHNFCAVGYLIKASGNEALSRTIARRNNLAYVQEMRYPELDQWAVQHGFTETELAWIQPAYPPATYVQPVGKGVNGAVWELATDQAGERLFVGGSFTEADSSLAAQHIAYVTAAGSNSYEWHAMGAGIDGRVLAIADYEGKIFAGGTFSQAGDQSAANIAYWENDAWHAAGCLYGTVSDLLVWNDKLYAAGSFDVCASAADINFAVWNGDTWTPLPGLSGRINTIEAMGDRLLLGGDFTYNNEKQNAILWDTEHWFTPFDNSITNEVMDFEMFNGKMYAACRQTDPNDSLSLLMALDQNSWHSVFQDPATFLFMPYAGKRAFHTLFNDGGSLLAGGQFRSIPEMMYMTANCSDVTPGATSVGNRYFYVDSAVHKMIRFKDELITGGSFASSVDPAFGNIPVPGIGRRILSETGVEEHDPAQVSLQVFPNPADPGSVVYIKHSLAQGSISLYDVAGKKLLSAALQPQQAQVQLPALAPGMYFLDIRDNKGLRSRGKIRVR